MKNCPVKNCPAKTREKIALLVAAVAVVVAVVAVLLRACPQASRLDN